MPSLADTVAALVQRQGWASISPSPVSPGGARRLRRVSAFGDNPGKLQMLVYTPETLPVKAPLVVVLHGCMQDAESYAIGAGWLTLADRYGFAVLCPEQTRGNNPNLCFNWFEPADTARDMGEAASIKTMIDHALAHEALDPRRVFITGLSAGGAMANAMLAAYPGTFSAGAIIAGLPYGAASNMRQAFTVMRRDEPHPAGFWGDAVRTASDHPGPWPRVSVWQGDGDSTVRPGAADDLVAQWLDVHGAQDVAIEIAAAGVGHRHLSWRSASGEPVVELHTIAGMGHGAALGCAVAEGCGAAGPYLLEVGVSSSLEIARFWRLAGARADGAAPAELNSADRGRGGAETVEQAGFDVNAIISTALRRAGLLR